MRPLLVRICCLTLLLIAAAGHAQTLAPGALDAWKGWVLKGQEFRNCPLIAGRAGNNANDFLCAWPGTLALAAKADGAQFSQHWRVDADGWVPLPGNAEHWPQEVTLDGQAAAVIDRNGPAVWLTVGGHELRGRLIWSQRPQSLQVPVALGVVALSVDGKPIIPVQQDGNELSLGRSTAIAPAADSLELRVFRRLSDGVPAQLTTVIELHASGQVREETIGPALPEGFAPVALDCDWPARLDADGRLRVRVQPGSDTLTLEARATAPLTQVTARLGTAPWPAQEIWSYAADPRLRVSVASSALPVDPRQSNVPPEWSALPAFAMGEDGKLVVEERSRGTAGDESNRLTLQREMWLDFAGDGWFAHDRLQGKMLRDWRLDVAAPFTLERAHAVLSGGRAGDSLQITRGAQASLSGVEWRQAAINVDAGLRINDAGMQMPISGWQGSFDSIQTVLHLPNGYRLLGAPGADRANGSWIAAWTLLDVFLAAVLILLAWRAFKLIGGLAAIAYLLLGYQEPGAPLWTLLLVCMLMVLVRALPEGRLATGVAWLRNGALALLLLVALPFIAWQVRLALHPQLENVSIVDAYAGNIAPAEQSTAEYAEQAQVVNMNAPAAMPAPATPPPPPEAKIMMQRASKSALDSIVVSGSRLPPRALVKVKEPTIVQTGNGEPNWQLGHRYELSWSGPVLAGQDVRLVIAPPWLVRPLRVVLAGLLLLLVGLALRPLQPQLRNVLGKLRSAAPLALLGLAALCAHTPAMAQTFPPDNLLNELRTRLTEVPKCAPNCAAIANAQVSARGSEVTVALDVQVAASSAVPLPFDATTLTLRSLRVDGVVQDALARDASTLRTALTRGVHRVELVFDASGDKVALAFALRPMRAHFVGEGWGVAGLADGRLQTETLTLTRARSSAENAAETSAHVDAQRFAPFVRVHRTLLLDTEWSVETRVKRIAPAGGGFTVAIPLLEGEHVTSSGFKIDNGTVNVALADGEDEASWTSTFDKRESLKLIAPALDAHAEVWQVVAGLKWHVDYSGVPRVAPLDAQAGEAMAFEFDPLPGETLALAISQPEAMQGATRAVDSVGLTQEVGQRASTTTLVLTLRASQGGEQAISLPKDAELLGLSRDGAPLNLRPQDGKLSLPLLPGSHRFEIRFRDNQTLGTRIATPAIALGLPAANIDLTMSLPRDRWLLATSGPATGPAVLYWSELAVMLLIAVALSRLPNSPLKLWQWLLLGIGFSTYSWLALIVVIAWLFALRWRARAAMPKGEAIFNLMQIGMVFFTLIAVLFLFDSIRHGLLGAPDMHVVGYKSSQYQLGWFADRSHDALPLAQAFSLPLWCYQVAMLVWALWLASALVRWMREGFAAWTRGGYWRSTPRALVELPKAQAPPPPPA
ncbi:MAG: hypothetical protein IT467_10995 [Dokdonella sp.]|nr:hypothetical protein [Dokdonella sp.]